MNIRALALGALVGFVVAFSPACSAPKCGPQNCDGCCDSKGTCVKKPNNNNNTTCGSAGNACVDCAAQATTCNPTTSTCSGTGAGGGTGGGTGGGGGSTTCDGCVLPSGACVPLSRTTNVNCGVGGAACNSCGVGQACTAGVCQVPDSGVAAIGSACTADSDCTSGVTLTSLDSQIGVKAYCKKTSQNLGGPAAEYTGGYCSKRCGFESNSCGTGNSCVYYFGDLGEVDNMCFKNCTQNADCRSGYSCIGITQTTGVCIPDTFFVDLPDGGSDFISVDAGPGFSGVSAGPCTTDTECQPPERGACIEESVDAGYVGGSCTAECSAVLSNDAWCGTEGSCTPDYAGNDSRGPVIRWFCQRGCGPQPDGGVAGTCRTGYVCDDPTYRFATCIPNCTNPGYRCGTGELCNPGSGRCEDDCRGAGITCPTGKTCNMTNGLCE